VNLFYQPLLAKGVHHLDEDESKHCVRVLRRNNGDTIRITDGQGFFYDVVIIDANPSKCSFAIKEKVEEPKADYFIHIAISPTKNADRIEWFVEKATEFGVNKITLIETEHTERSFLKTERLKKVALAAMKQSLKATLPAISGVTKFTELIQGSNEEQCFIACVDEDNPLHLRDAALPGKSGVVLIGPEGDFSKDEMQFALSHGFVKVSLGKSRLRTETAGISACHILNLINT
jgi:16S rRNA (uracil1498-N3)-methyltransferase